MSALKDWLRKLIPTSVLEQNRKRKKARRREELNNQKKAGRVVSHDMLVDQLKSMGIQKGDTLMIHCSLSKLGYVEEGAQGLISALLEAIGEKGNLLMPSSPVTKLQLDFAKENRSVDLRIIPSAMGALSENFRKYTGVKRSTHPTEPVLCFGPDSEWLTSGHLNQLTPYNETSPYRRMMELNGKVLYAGVTLDNAGTHLHTLEDAVDFPYEVYYPEVFQFDVIDGEGNIHQVSSKVHNPEWSVKRRCDELLPLFDAEAGMSRPKLGQADCLLLSTSEMFKCMTNSFESKGITMYHPKGIKNS